MIIFDISLKRNKLILKYLHTKDFICVPYNLNVYYIWYMETTTLHIRNVPIDVKARFKGACAVRGLTMEQLSAQTIVTQPPESFEDMQRNRFF